MSCAMIRSDHLVSSCLVYLLFSFFLYLQAWMQKFCITRRLLNLSGLDGEDEQTRMGSIAQSSCGEMDCVLLLLLQCKVYLPYASAHNQVIDWFSQGSIFLPFHLVSKGELVI